MGRYGTEVVARRAVLILAVLEQCDSLWGTQ